MVKFATQSSWDDTMNNLDLLRRITRDLWYWQGLRFAPMGIVGFIAAATFSPGWPDAVPPEGALLAGLAVAFVLYRAADRYYARSMGHVSPDLSLTKRRSAIKWFAVYPAMGVALVIDGLAEPPLFITGAVWAVALVLYWWSTGRGREHYLVLAGLTSLLTLLPLVDPTLAGKGAFPIFYAWFGVVYVVAGVLDHLALTRALPRAEAS
jgi:hypothetical protein